MNTNRLVGGNQNPSRHVYDPVRHAHMMEHVRELVAAIFALVCILALATMPRLLH
jgi:hypothetical protein